MKDVTASKPSHNETFSGSDYAGKGNSSVPDHDFSSATDLSNKVSVDILEHLEDLRIANFCEAEIMQILDLPLIPPKEMVFKILGRCSRCGLLDHQRSH
jgi:hypothetical protein